MKTNKMVFFDKTHSKDYTSTKTIETKGKVNIYKNGKLDSSYNNLVVYLGREFAIQKVFNIATNKNDYRDYNVTYFGIGSGGADPNDGTILTGPKNDDIGLYTPLQISTQTTSQYLDNGKLKKITSSEIILDPVTKRNTTVKHILEIDPSVDDNIKNIAPYSFNEAGLFAVDQNTNSFILFAHVCFPTKILDVNDKIMIEWYILM